MSVVLHTLRPHIINNNAIDTNKRKLKHTEYNFIKETFFIELKRIPKDKITIVINYIRLNVNKNIKRKGIFPDM